MIIERFLKHVNKTETCWFWKGAKKGQNYGSFSINGKDYRAHRVSYKIFISDFDDNLHVLHKCDNSLCVRPDHLFLGTHQKNMIDKVNKNRQSKMRGELSPTHKLSLNQVNEIKKLLKSPYRGYINNIAKIYSVSSSCILDIKYGRTWN
jgi:hypothetical protein